eukprot:g4660.t1
MPRIDQPKYVTNVSKYLGYIPKKGPCNQFSTRWHQGIEIAYQRLGKCGPAKLERAVNQNERQLRKTKSMKTIQRVPNTATNQPGVYSETVVGKKFGAANERGQELREYNPYGTAKWFHRDPKYSLSHVRLIPGSDLKCDLMDQYTEAENKYASLCASSTELMPVQYTEPMSWVKYTGALSQGLSYNPGNIAKPVANGMRPAGQWSHYGTEQLEAARWQMHMWYAKITIRNSSNMSAEPLGPAAAKRNRVLLVDGSSSAQREQVYRGFFAEDSLLFQRPGEGGHFSHKTIDCEFYTAEIDLEEPMGASYGGTRW